MRSMFAKIFVSFWITQILILVAIAFLWSRPLDSPQIQHRFLFRATKIAGEAALRAYLIGGCPALQGLSHLATDVSYLVDENGQFQCLASEKPKIEGLLSQIHPSGDRLVGVQVGDRLLWGVPVRRSPSQLWIFVIGGPVHDSSDITLSEVLSRLLVAVAVSGIVTFALALFLARPITALRTATRKLAAGELSARAGLKVGASGPHRSSPSYDEVSGLVHDFNNMAERIESLVAAQRLLLRDVSHELRSPLARLSVALELAREEAQPEMEEHLSRIERETEMLNRLIGELLSLSQMESANRIPNAEKVAMKPLLTRLVADAEYEARSHGCSVVLTTAEDCYVNGNPTLIARAIENIVRNAITHTAERTTVLISLLAETSDGVESAIVRVSDCGAGVPEKHLKHIFQPFYRLDDARQRATGGSGVGLAIAERAIRLHAGSVVASNSPQGGLMVEVRIPSGSNELG